MAAYGKGRATGYTDFYKGREQTPSGTEQEESEVPDTAKARRLAIQRRLKKKKVGM